jgi:hypothetical protein
VSASTPARQHASTPARPVGSTSTAIDQITADIQRLRELVA